MAARAGSKAPDFTLKNQDMQEVRLSDNLGKQHVVLAFFPAAFTSVCEKELCSFRDQLAQLNQAAAQVYGISTDTFFTLKAFADKNRLNFPLLSDYNKAAITAYDVVNEDMLGLKNISKRAVFLIDKQGIIQYAEVTANPGVEPDYAKLNEEIAKLSAGAVA